MKSLLRKIRDEIIFKPHHPVVKRIGYAIDGIRKTRFVTIEDIALLTNEWAANLPKDFDAIVAIPRTGLMTGAIVANQLSLPLSVPEKFPECWGVNRIPEDARVLIVDDSSDTGDTIQKVKISLSNKFPAMTFKTGVPVGKKSGRIDFIGNVFEKYVIETDIMSYPDTIHVGCDIDGVLCVEPPDGIDEKKLSHYYQNARPYKIPRMKLHFIASGRTEVHREVTEAWLKKYNIHYGNLILRNEKSIINTKCDAIMKFSPHLFYESNSVESKMIHLKTGCRVLCFDEMVLYG